MNNVDLGYLEPGIDWRLQSRFFPSKAGGQPAWLNLENVPCGDDLTCPKCKEILIFLCQIYAPYEEDDNNFHRTLFVFICKNARCYERNNSDAIRIFRSVLPRHNKFYSSEPPVEQPDPDFDLSKWLSLCSVCGCVGNERCSKCNVTTYCSREHQTFDWKERHKKNCGNDGSTSNSRLLFPEHEIYIESEIINKSVIDEKKETQKFLELQKKGKSGTINDLDEKELDQLACKDVDKTFMRFRKRIEDSPSQVLRYSRGDEPLFISDELKPENIPNCEYCGGPRQFEFQIMPQILALMEIKDVDWGILIFYTCKTSCTEGANYKKEFVFKQDVSEISM